MKLLCFMCFLNSRICCFVKSLCLYLCEVTKLRIKCISRIRNIAIFWCDKINIVVNLWNCDLCERCECSYLLFAKIQILNFCDLSTLLFFEGCGSAHLIFLWVQGFYCLWIFDITIFRKVKVRTFPNFVKSWILHCCKLSKWLFVWRLRFPACAIFLKSW